MKQRTILQDFEWYLPEDGQFWNQTAAEAQRLADLGFTDIWLPPAYKGQAGIHDVGYVPVYVWGNKHVFHLICSGDFYQQRPDGMSDEDFQRMKQSVREITKMIGEDGIALLPN